MIEYSMRRLLKLIPAGSAVLAGTTIISYAVGLLRDRTFAQIFGASRSLDAYNAAFLLPDLLFNFLIASGIAAAFVPIFTEVFRKDKEKAYEYTNSAISGATGIMMLSAIIIFIFAKPISVLAAPGFPTEDLLMVASIIRILAISPILFGISNTLGAMLIAKRRFFFYGLSPVLYNLGIIGGTIFLSPVFGITGVAIGTVVGAFFHMLMRVIDAYLSGYKFHFNFDFKTPEFKKTIKLMLPKMFGHPVELAMFWGFTVIASGLASGSVAVMNFARNFMSVPVSIIGITFATTAFPVMAKAISENSQEDFKKILKSSFWLILGGSILAAIITFFIREPLIRIVLGGGAFNQTAVARTALTLGFFTLAMPTESLVHLLARAFYATKNTTVPVVMSILGLIIAIAGGYLLVPSLDIVAIPVAFFAASLIELILLIILLPRRLKKISEVPKIDVDFDPHQA